MAISAEDRRTRILEAVRTLGTVRLVELAERLGIPAVTVRRDVAALARAGSLNRSHGAVSRPRGPSPGVPEGRAPVIGMLVPTLGTYFEDVIEGARSAASAARARLVLGIASYEARDDRLQVSRLLETGVDGLLLTPNRLPGGCQDEHAWLDDLPVPAVLVERQATSCSPGAALDSVSSDHHHGVLIALRHLASLGHRSVLLAARDDSWTAHRVRTGYAEGIRLLGLDRHPVADIPSSGSPTSAGLLADRIAHAARSGVGAVLVHNDHEAIQLPLLLRARGIVVPDDMALISYDDVFAGLAAPALTAVAPPRHDVGAVAMDLLLRRLGSDVPPPGVRIELLPTLKLRASCSRAAADPISGSGSGSGSGSDQGM